MSDFRKLSDNVWASPQIGPDEVAEAQGQGFSMIINNRPEHEEPGQPGGDSIAAAAAAAGMKYLAIPIDHSGFSDEKVATMADALADAGEDGKVLAYCRSGTRSTFLWALAQASAGAEPDGIVSAARSAGYDVAPIRPALEMLSARHEDR